MPQMMPMNWLMFLLFFFIMLILFNIMNYYTPFKKMSHMYMFKMTNKTLNWKW
nr:ATP synthase F0 subunit 8 [Pseudovates chlorophaea]